MKEPAPRVGVGGHASPVKRKALPDALAVCAVNVLLLPNWTAATTSSPDRTSKPLYGPSPTAKTVTRSLLIDWAQACRHSRTSSDAASAVRIG
jgi:hypothetical protein